MLALGGVKLSARCPMEDKLGQPTFSPGRRDTRRVLRRGQLGVAVRVAWGSEGAEHWHTAALATASSPAVPQN